MKTSMPLQYTLRKLADFLQAELRGDEALVVKSIAPLDRAKEGDISFLVDANYAQYLSNTKASAILIKAEDVNPSTSSAVLIVKDPYVAYAKVSALFADVPVMPIGVHPTAVIGNNCRISSKVAIGPYCVIGDGAIIGDNVSLGAGCSIGEEAQIGKDTKLNANVSVYYRTTIGERCLIHSGTVIGSDGFGMANESGVWRKIYQLGRVVIGNDVEIGANVTIDRGALNDTVIEDGVKLDNQIQVGHNVRIGAHTAIAGCVGIAGSTKIGKHCMIGGGVGINGHIEIADGTIITARSNVHKSITTPGGIYASGIPAVLHRQWWRILKHLFQLDEYALRLKKLEKKIYE